MVAATLPPSGTVATSEGYKCLMKRFLKAGSVLVALAIFAAAAVAGPVTGIWHGKVRFDTTKIPTQNAADRQKLMSMVKAQENVKLTLTVKGDHTYSMIVIGAPKQVPTVTGSWSQAGNKITITPSVAGKPSTPRTFTLTADTKSFSFTEGPVTMSFNR